MRWSTYSHIQFLYSLLWYILISFDSFYINIFKMRIVSVLSVYTCGGDIMISRAHYVIRSYLSFQALKLFLLFPFQSFSS